MNIGQKVKIKNTNSVWDNKEGILEEIDGDTCTVFVDFIPSEHKRVRQDFNIDNVDFDAYNNSSEENNMNEDLKLREDDIQDDDTQFIIKALAEHLGVDEEDIELSSWGDGHNFITPEGEYWVGTYDEAYDAASEEIEQIYDEMGLEAFSESFQSYILDNLIDWSAFEDDMTDYYRGYIDDIESEGDAEYDNRLLAEMVDAGILTDDDFIIDGEDEWAEKTLSSSVDLEYKKDEFLDYLCSNMDVEDFVKDIYSNEELSQVVVDNNLIDLDSLVEECISEDGIAHFLATYDGDEIDLGNNLYAYRRG